MDKRFLAAFTDPTARTLILGRFVSPFCLLHRVKLEAVESPFVRSGKDFRPIDLLIAVKICAGEPVGKLTWKDSWYLGRMRASETYFVRQLVRFSEFVMIEAWPKFWEKKTSQKDTSGIPWPLNVVTALMKHGVTEERAWTMPEAQAIWLNSAIAIANGADMKVFTAEDEALIEQLEKTQE
jgi:hypothetical protein